MADNYLTETLNINKMLENLFLEKFVVPVCDALKEKYPMFQETPHTLMEIVSQRTGVEFSVQPKKSIAGTGCQVPIKCGINKGKPCGKGVKGLNKEGLPACGRHVNDPSTREVGSSSGRTNFSVPPTSFQGFPAASQFAPLSNNSFVPQSQFTVPQQQVPVNIGSIPVSDGNRLQIHTTKIKGSNEYYDPATNIIYKMINDHPQAFARYDENHNVLALREKEISICTVNGASYTLTDPLELTKEEVEVLDKPQFSKGLPGNGFGLPSSTLNNKFSTGSGGAFNSFVPPTSLKASGFGDFKQSTERSSTQKRASNPRISNPRTSNSRSSDTRSEDIEPATFAPKSTELTSFTQRSSNQSEFIKQNEPTTFGSFAPPSRSGEVFY